MIRVLKASAGTGKTYRLSLEYVASLLKGEDFEEIAVMTFTRKATAEIRERIFEHIKDILEQGRDCQAFTSLREIYPQLQLNRELLADCYRRMLLNKDQINIYTIDSFINQVFKKAVAPYLDIYQYEIIEEEQNEEIIAGVFKKILDNPDDFQLMEKFLWQHTERDIDVYLDLIKKLLNNRWKFLVIDYEPITPREADSPGRPLDHCLNLLESAAERRGEEFGQAFFVKDFKDLINNYRQLSGEANRRQLLLDNWKLFFKKSFWNGRKLGRKSLADLKEELEAVYEEFRENLACHVFNEEIIPYEQEVYNFSSRIFEIYDRIKFRKKAFTHTDISNYTYKYFFQEKLELMSGDQVSDYFYELIGGEVRHLFIDEFQDTSILQWKLLRPLVNRCQQVIAVGDEKQSIYGWRGGEKKLFARLEEILGGQTQTLDLCYRSQRQVINFVNRFFNALDQDWEYSHVDHLPAKDGGYVEVMVGGKQINTNTKAFRRKDQAEQEYLRQLNQQLTDNLEGEIAATIEEKVEDYSSTAVLARSNEELVQIAEELDKRDIPYILESQDSLLDHEAVKPLYFLLGYLYAGDYFKLLQFLRSDPVGINNSTLKYLLQHKNQVENLLDSPPANRTVRADPGSAPETIDPEYEGLSRLLLEIRSLTDLGYRELTDYIINRTGVLDLYSGNIGALRNLYFLFEEMRDFSSLSEFMEYLEENRDSDRLKQVGVTEAEAVNLLTIHKAKGLSFDTEFFYWKPRSLRSGSGDLKIYLQFDEEYENVEDYLLTNSDYRPVFEYLDIDFAEQEREKQLMEEINNVYVALTRPRNNLFFYIETPRQLKNPDQGMFWAGSSYEFYEPALLVGARVEDLQQLVTPWCSGQQIMGSKGATDTGVLLSDVSGYFKGEKLSEETLRQYNENKDLSQKLAGDLRRLSGLAVHYYLEHVRYNSPEELQYARQMVQAKYGNILGPKKTQEIVSRAYSFVRQHPELFAGRWRVFTEYRLTADHKNYRIDRLMVDESRRQIRIIDYKTGELKQQAQLEQYEKIIRDRTDSDYQITSDFLEV